MGDNADCGASAAKDQAVDTTSHSGGQNGIAQVDAHDLRRLIGDFERLLRLVARSAAELRSDLDATATSQFSALYSVEDIAAKGADHIGVASDTFSETSKVQTARIVSSEIASEDQTVVATARKFEVTATAFAGEVKQVSSTSSQSIATEVSKTSVHGQSFDLARQKMQALENVSDIAHETMSKLDAALAGADGGIVSLPALPLERLKNIYVSDDQRRLHSEIIDDVVVSQEPEKAPIELF